ncbi:hypothetical protein LZ32DRAFT_608220 [Colletotrichum eremochloae]|nr:hypothetical protein LZ32DRAFT_608220 [Colletotrichum eremochloae]
MLRHAKPWPRLPPSSFAVQASRPSVIIHPSRCYLLFAAALHAPPLVSLPIPASGSMFSLSVSLCSSPGSL